MISLKSPGTFSGAGVLSAIAASLCCITPVIALLAGSSSVAANFSWIEPARPYLIVVSIAVLVFAWYLRLNQKKISAAECNCDTEQKPSFFFFFSFLIIVTVFAILMMTFPLYAKIFFPKPKAAIMVPAATDSTVQAKFSIQGMTCAGCEEHVNNQLSKLHGVLTYQTSYANGYSIVTFDKLKTDVKVIETAINKTGYKVKEYKLLNEEK